MYHIYHMYIIYISLLIKLTSLNYLRKNVIDFLYVISYHTCHII